MFEEIWEEIREIYGIIQVGNVLVKKYDMSMDVLRNEKFKHISYRKRKRIIAGRE